MVNVSAVALLEMVAELRKIVLPLKYKSFQACVVLPRSKVTLAAGNRLPLNVVLAVPNTAVLLMFWMPIVTGPPAVTVTLLWDKDILDAAAAVTPVIADPLPVKN